MAQRETTPVRALDARWQQRLTPPNGAPGEPALRRQLGLASATLIVVGSIIGSGIFFTPAATARALPASSAILLVWIVGGVVAFAGALCYAELGAMMPDAGGA